MAVDVKTSVEPENSGGACAGGRRIKLLLVTGVSGAGKTSTLGALSDCGYEMIDNPPIRLIHAIMDDFAASGPRDLRVAMGVDESTNGFTTERFADTVSSLRQRSDMDTTLLFLDCSTETLVRRYTETRRRHPMGHMDSMESAVIHERSVVLPLKEEADVSLDTSDLSLTELRREIQQRFAENASDGMSISITSFGFKRGAPRDVDVMFDVRFLANPYWNPELRYSTGLDAEVDEFVTQSEGFDTVFGSLSRLMLDVLPHYQREGKSYLSIAIGCTGGRHRSVAVAERLGAIMRTAGHAPVVRHRDLRHNAPDRPVAPVLVNA